MRSRNERRFVIGQPGSVVILGKPGSVDTRVPCRIVDISRGGMRLAVDVPVPSDAVLKLEWDDHFLLGTPRYVRLEGAEYQIGVELLTCSTWREGWPNAVSFPAKVKTAVLQFVSSLFSGEGLRARASRP